MKSIITLLLLAVLALHPNLQAQSSKVETHVLPSKALKAQREYSIYLPPSYDVDTARRYPVLYLLHGMWDTHTAWFEKGSLKAVMDLLLASGEVREMIVVSPNAGGNISEGIWNGYFDMPGWPYETFFFSEFIPHLESTYRILPSKQHRAVAGLSMGGGGCTKYAQWHPGMFCAAYAMSALMSIPTHETHLGESANQQLALLTRSVIDNDCVRYVEQADDSRKQALSTVAWLVDCGDQDFLLDGNLRFHQAMRKAGIPSQLRVRAGGHVWEYWHSALYNCLPFVSRHFDI